MDICKPGTRRAALIAACTGLTYRQLYAALDETGSMRQAAPKPARPKPAKVAKPPKPVPIPSTKRTIAPAPRIMPPARPPEGPAIIPDGLQVTRLPGFVCDARYAVSGPVVGGFATLGIGRYLDGSAA